MRFDIFNAFFWAYKLSLGEYDTDGFVFGDQEQSILLWAIFLFATFILQITFLNMLIAIMNDTFTEFAAKKYQSAMNEKINILSDFRLVLMNLNLDMNFNYLYIVKPMI